MDRQQLMTVMQGTTTPNDMSDAINAARAWLLDHPDDEGLRDALQHLMRAEREFLSVGR